MNDPSSPSDELPETTYPSSGIEPTEDERNLAIIAHASGIAGFIGGGLIGFVGPLVVYLMKKDNSHYVETQAKEALNFQITLLLFSVAMTALAIMSCGILIPIAVPLGIAVPVIGQIVFGILATLAVRDGKFYRYPFNFRLIQ